MKHIKWPSIESLALCKKSIARQDQFIGIDENGEGIYDETISLSTITFCGSVKLHGTNAGVCYNNVDGLWAQSRDSIISHNKQKYYTLRNEDGVLMYYKENKEGSVEVTTSDNSGFDFFVEKIKEELIKEIKDYASEKEINLDTHTIAIFGEWCGKGIQKGTGISQIDKSLFVFGCRVVENNSNTSYHIDECSFSLPESNVYNIWDYGKTILRIDFNTVDQYIPIIETIVNKIEDECPVAKAFNVTGIGEGIVFYGYNKGIRHSFKVKGEKHRVTDEGVKSEITPKRDITEFIDLVVTNNRINQGITETKIQDIKDIKTLINWVFQDVLKEEIERMKVSDIEPKTLIGPLSRKVVEYYKLL